MLDSPFFAKDVLTEKEAIVEKFKKLPEAVQMFYADARFITAPRGSSRQSITLKNVAMGRLAAKFGVGEQKKYDSLKQLGLNGLNEEVVNEIINERMMELEISIATATEPFKPNFCAHTNNEIFDVALMNRIKQEMEIRNFVSEFNQTIAPGLQKMLQEQTELTTKNLMPMVEDCSVKGLASRFLQSHKP